MSSLAKVAARVHAASLLSVLLTVAPKGPLHGSEGVILGCGFDEVEESDQPGLAFLDLLPLTLRFAVANHGAPRIVITDPRTTPLETYGFTFHRLHASNLHDAEPVSYRATFRAVRVGDNVLDAVEVEPTWPFALPPGRAIFLEYRLDRPMAEDLQPGRYSISCTSGGAVLRTEDGRELESNQIGGAGKLFHVLDAPEKPSEIRRYFALQSRLALAQGETDLAIDRLRRAVEADPSYAATELDYANLLKAHGRCRDAIEVYRRALGPRYSEASPPPAGNFPTSWTLGLLECHLELGEHDAVQDTIRRFFSKDPDAALARARAALRQRGVSRR
jgi:hypothetical protein